MSYVRCKMNHARFTQLQLGLIRPEGWLKDQMERSKAGMGGTMPEIEPELIGKAYRSLDCHSHFQAGWTSEIAGTYWLGLIQLAFTLHDPELMDRASAWVHDVLKLQDPDGFLGVHREADNRYDDYCAWGNNWGYRALLCYYDATNETAVLEAVHRALLWFTEHWTGDKKTSYAGPIITDSMVTVYHLTGDKRLLDWAEEYKEWLAKPENDKFYHGSTSMRRPKFHFYDDHVAAFGENAKNPAVLYSATGNAEELETTRAGFRQIFNQGWQVTGAPSGNSEHFSPPSCILETEYCNFSIYHNSFAWMGKITGEPLWFDRMEKIFFNGAQGARMKNEKGIAYMSCPNQSSATSTDGSYNAFMTVARRVYAPNYYVSCCPMQSIRICPEYVRNAFLWDSDGAFCAAVYGPVRTMPEEGIVLSEETEYPFDETVSFRFQCAKPWAKTFRLRKPEWCRQYTILRNGKPAVFTESADSWIELSGPWNDGDLLTIKFTMEAKLEPVQDAWFQREPLRAYSYGPLVFCHAFPQQIRELTEYPPIYVQQNPEANCPVSGGEESKQKVVSPSKKYPWYDITAPSVADVQWYAVPGNAKDGCGIQIVRKPEHGYVWEDSPVRLKVPLFKATNSWDRSGTMLAMPFGNPVQPDAGSVLQTVELVPFGCTNLRQTCFPVTE